MDKIRFMTNSFIISEQNDKITFLPAILTNHKQVLLNAESELAHT